MQSVKILRNALEELCDSDHYLFSVSDFRSLLPEHFNYISLETALSNENIISQIPFNRITLMSSGRKSIIDCGTLGSIEFVHTKKKPNSLAGRLIYDDSCRLWRANRELALEDIKAVGRNLNLIEMKNYCRKQWRKFRICNLLRKEFTQSTPGR